MIQVRANDVRQALAALDCPASEQEVVAEAERVGASDEVVRVLRALPLADYDNVDEIVRSVETAEATELAAAADKVALARDRGDRMLAEHQRRPGG